MQRKHNKFLTPTAKELRLKMTNQEKHLWYDFLRNYPIRIVRQKVISKFIVDFYCSKVKLAIELDGSQHYSENGLAYDEERTKILNAFRIQVLRFSNREIDTNFNSVCELIDKKVKELLLSQDK